MFVSAERCRRAEDEKKTDDTVRFLVAYFNRSDIKPPYVELALPSKHKAPPELRHILRFFFLIKAISSFQRARNQSTLLSRPFKIKYASAGSVGTLRTPSVRT